MEQLHATFDNAGAAQNAVRLLRRRGAAPASISVSAAGEVANTAEEFRTGEGEGETDTETTVSGISGGSAVGAAAGAAMTAAAAIALPVSLPVLALVTLGGAGAGALGGAVAGAILGSVFEAKQEEALQEELRSGRVLVSVTANEQDARLFEETLAEASGRLIRRQQDVTQ